ncbi:hypothetical protein K7432_014726 [Basidiobolus ranarum]|uniref:FAD-binding PCMH-type domain-containing protein n=1 Tax=Basidiobolus ranarum TaxID=34480 RepID=A0ABR2WHB6_9FUNG
MKSILLLAVLPAVVLCGVEECLRELGTPTVNQASGNYSKVNYNYNTRHNFNPLLYVVARDVVDVQNAVKCAVNHNIPISARSGGHSYEGYSQGGRNGDVIVDLSNLNNIQIDKSTKTAIVGAGSLLGPTYYKLFKGGGFGIPAGSCPQVGIGGHALGGGFGLFSRKYGMVSDNVLEIQIVNPSGQLLVANTNQNSDLFWALRGGGQGSFGIVTSFKFKLFTPPSKVTTFSYSWDYKQFNLVYKAFQDWAFTNPSEDVGPNMYVDRNGIVLQGVFQGPKAELSQHLSGILSASPQPSNVAIKEGSFLDAVSYFSGMSGGVEALANIKFGQGRRTYMKAHSAIIQKPITTQGIQVLRDTLAKAPGYGYFLFDLYGGAIARVNGNTTAFLHRGGADIITQMVIQPPTATDLDKTWLTEAYQSVKPYFSSAAYQNYIDRDLQNWQTAYFGENLNRLVQVKKVYDPTNVFNFAQSIPLNV